MFLLPTHASFTLFSSLSVIDLTVNLVERTARSCRTQKKKFRTGFTLIELLVAISLISVVAVITTPYLFGALEKQQLLAEQERLSTFVQKARSRSVTAEKGRQYGLRFETRGFIELPENTVSSYAHGVRMSSSSSSEVSFEKLTGQRIPEGAQLEVVQLQSPRFQVTLAITPQGTVVTGKVETR